MKDGDVITIKFFIYFEISKNNYFTEHLRTTASDIFLKLFFCWNIAYWDLIKKAFNLEIKKWFQWMQ